MKRPVDEGTGVETFTLNNVTLTNALVTAAPQPGVKVPCPLGLGDQVQPGFGFIYNVAGGKTYPMTGGKAVGPIPVLTLSNYTPPGNASRGLITAGLAINAPGDFISLSADWRCVDSDGKVTTETATSIATALDLLVNELSQSTRIAAGAMRVTGTAAQTQAGEGGDTKATGTWSLTAVP